MFSLGVHLKSCQGTRSIISASSYVGIPFRLVEYWKEVLWAQHRLRLVALGRTASSLGRVEELGLLVGEIRAALGADLWSEDWRVRRLDINHVRMIRGGCALGMQQDQIRGLMHVGRITKITSQVIYGKSEELDITQS